MNPIKYYQSTNPFLLENGQSIEELTLAYQTFGALNADRDNVIWVFHPLTANTNVLEWWPGLFGENKLFDPKSDFIICANAIGSPYGSTCPKNKKFPLFSVRDVANTFEELANFLHIEKIKVAIGPSFGGNQAIEFAYSFSGKIDQLILVASSSRESAWGIAIHESQRVALLSDGTFEQPQGGQEGLKAARSLAMLTYRTADQFIKNQTDELEITEEFRASSYIRYQGDKFAQRFDAMCYYYLSKCMDQHHLGRGRGGEAEALSQIKTPTLILGINSDLLVPIRLQKFMDEHLPNSVFKTIDSEYGHDGFLIESEQLTNYIQPFLKEKVDAKLVGNRKVLKFGGSSLVKGEALNQVIKIVEQESKLGALAVVVSARGNTTDLLEELYERAVSGQNWMEVWDDFLTQQETKEDLWFQVIFQKLEALTHLGERVEQIKNELLAYGELFSARFMVDHLQRNGLKSICIDARDFLVVENQEVNETVSKENCQIIFKQLERDAIVVVTGFIARDENGKTTHLGRNGSNYTATLLASFIGASEVQNWTDIDGIYTGHPGYVTQAKQIPFLTYKEANELANFGARIIHPKTVRPLLSSNIPLRILNTWEPEKPGTLISNRELGKGMKAVNVIEDLVLIKIEGSGLLKKIGIDGRIFQALSHEDISVRMISQASSERGIGFVIDSLDRKRAEHCLNKEFQQELNDKVLSSISTLSGMSIIAIVGRHNYSLEKAIGALRKNKIWMHLISNSISGEHISLVVDKKHTRKALNVVHNQVFSVRKTLHVFAFGKGNVGGEFIDQVLSTNQEIENRRELTIKIVGVADSKRFLFNKEGISQDWKTKLQQSHLENDPRIILHELSQSNLENIVVVDNTSSEELLDFYPDFIRLGFDLVASNKKANAAPYSYYKNIRNLLIKNSTTFAYETNVGAGLPVIDTLVKLRDAADEVTDVLGVFSGSLSYIFNAFSIQDRPFSEVMLEARANGFTEPDAREDLSGLDVARKLLILARELGSSRELEDVQVQNLIPDFLQDEVTFDDFLKRRDELDEYYANLKSNLQDGHVYRYVGKLHQPSNSLSVELIQTPASSALGSLKNADALFEIYTDTYGQYPMIIQGAGAGAEVTARGVYSDLLRLGGRE